MIDCQSSIRADRAYFTTYSEGCREYKQESRSDRLEIGSDHEVFVDEG